MLLKQTILSFFKAFVNPSIASIVSVEQKKNICSNNKRKQK